MKITIGNQIKEIKNVIFEKVRFQKVMLLFDDYVSNVEILSVYDSIKEICVFNQANINNVDFKELNNGYRAIIFLCGVDDFLRFKHSREDFINIYCPTDGKILPFYLNNQGFKTNNKDYYISESSNVDVAMLSSFSFNQFFNYLKKIVVYKNQMVDFSILQQEITQQNLISAIEKCSNDFEFLDVKILKECGIEYKKIPLVDLLLINSFMLFIMAIKQQTLSMVDVYKVSKDDYGLIDKFFSLSNNSNFINLITLNYNCLINFCEKMKQKILSCLRLVEFEESDVDKLIEKIKNYSKKDEGILSYLYLYNVFGM